MATLSQRVRCSLTHTMVALLASAFLVGGVHAKAPTPRKASKAKSATKNPTPTPKAARRNAQTTANKTFSLADGKRIFAEANKHYNAGEYGKSAQLFQKLVAQPEWQHFSVFYNLGNNYFRLQHYGKALAHYRKAQRLRPNDTALLHNIQLLYKRVGKSEQDAPQRRIKAFFWYSLLNLKQLFFVVIFLTYLLLLAWAWHIRRKAIQSTEKGALRWFVAGLATITTVLWLSLGIKAYREEVRKVGVVTVERISARSGYGTRFEPMFWLSEADEVLIVEKISVTNKKGKSAVWLRVEFQQRDKKTKRRTKRVGWIPGNALQQI